MIVHLKDRFPRLQKQYAFEVRVLYQKLTGNNNPLAVEQCSLEELRSPFDQEVIDTDIENLGEEFSCMN